MIPLATGSQWIFALTSPAPARGGKYVVAVVDRVAPPHAPPAFRLLHLTDLGEGTFLATLRVAPADGHPGGQLVVDSLELPPGPVGGPRTGRLVPPRSLVDLPLVPGEQLRYQGRATPVGPAWTVDATTSVGHPGRFAPLGGFTQANPVVDEVALRGPDGRRWRQTTTVWWVDGVGPARFDVELPAPAGSGSFSLAGDLVNASPAGPQARAWFARWHPARRAHAKPARSGRRSRR